jgi:hypothetical protein
MTPKEKAKELVNNVGKIIGKELKNGGFKYNFGMAKHCALKTVDEMLNFMFLSENENSFWINYYNEVKKEIEKL